MVRGDESGWRLWGLRPAQDLLAAADAHGLLSLLAASAEAADCPVALRTTLQTEARRQLAGELVREHELRQVVVALHEAGVGALLMKGADLAYGIYPRPDLRPRTDSDLLVDTTMRAAAAAVLERLGYERVPQTGGDLLMYQEPFRRCRGGSVAHVVDLHWRVFNPQRYGATFTFEDLERDAQRRPTLSPCARGLGRVHALALACVHRVAHHFDQDRLIWLYDVRLLAADMQAEEWDALLALADSRGIQLACLRTLEAASDAFAAQVPVAVLRTLRASGQGHEDAAFFDPRAAHARRVWSDLRHVEGWGSRLSVARQHLFPPARYMRTVYAPASGAPLWFLYARRIVRGSRRWLVGS